MKRRIFMGLISISLLSLAGCVGRQDENGVNVNTTVKNNAVEMAAMENTATEKTESKSESMPEATQEIAPEVSSEPTSNIVQELPKMTLPHDIILKETAKIMESYSIGDTKAAVGYDKDYNIFVNFISHKEDRRIPVKNSDENELEWLMYTREGSEEDKINLDMFPLRDSITGKDYYFLRLFFSGAPYDVNQFYLFDAEQGVLMDYQTLSNAFDTKTGVNATLIKNGDEYNIAIPDYGIEQKLNFPSIYEHELKMFRGEAEWDEFIMDTVIQMGSIDTFEVNEDKMITRRPVSADNGKWAPPMYIETLYEIQNGIITPMEYRSIPGGAYSD